MGNAFGSCNRRKRELPRKRETIDKTSTFKYRVMRCQDAHFSRRMVIFDELNILMITSHFINSIELRDQTHLELFNLKTGRKLRYKRFCEYNLLERFSYIPERKMFCIANTNGEVELHDVRGPKFLRSPFYKTIYGEILLMDYLVLDKDHILMCGKFDGFEEWIIPENTMRQHHFNQNYANISQDKKTGYIFATEQISLTIFGFRYEDEKMIPYFNIELSIIQQETIFREKFHRFVLYDPTIQKMITYTRNAVFFWKLLPDDTKILFKVPPQHESNIENVIYLESIQKMMISSTFSDQFYDFAECLKLEDIDPAVIQPKKTFYKMNLLSCKTYSKKHNVMISSPVPLEKLIEFFSFRYTYAD